jgi:hypothetical protein
MKIVLNALFSSIFLLAAQGGDWGRAPVDKTPIEECGVLGAGL